MIAKSVVAGLSLALISASPAPGTINNGMPPERFRGDSIALVIFTDRAGIDKMCGVAPPGHYIIACKRTLENGAPIVIMPNPCPLGEVEFYAKIMCHENGHVNGWSGEHEA